MAYLNSSLYPVLELSKWKIILLISLLLIMLKSWWINNNGYNIDNDDKRISSFWGIVCDYKVLVKPTSANKIASAYT